MKKEKMITWLLCLCLAVQLVPISVKAASGASGWTLSGISLSHTTAEFRISGVESAQDATVVIESKASSSEDSVCYEIPFSISSAIDDIKIDIPEGGYLPAGTYSVYVKDSLANVTGKRTASVNSHYYRPDYKLYPNWAEVTNSYDATYHLRLTVGFENYDVIMEPDSTEIISYPTQDDGTAIEVKWWDDYGCSGAYVGTVESEDLYLPSLVAFKDSIAVRYADLDENERVGADVEGTTYYSDYGKSDNSYRTIPNFITYPQVSDTTTTVSAWVESKNGSKSEPVELEIESCELSDCDVVCKAYLAQVSGTVKENQYGNKITKVSTSIGGSEYSCNVDEDGGFVLKYPKQKCYTDITVCFSDEHGCATSKDVTIYNALENARADIDVGLSSASGEVDTDCRLTARIGGNVYYSSYATNTQVVTVNYPKQKSGQTIVFWYEKKDTSQSPCYTLKVPSREYTITADARTGRISGTVEGEPENNCSYKVLIKAGGKEYECKMTKRDSSYDEEYDALADFYYDFSCSYPLQKVGSTIQIIVRDTDGYEYAQSVVLKNIKPSISLQRIDTSTTKIKGRTAAKSKITVKIGKKTYTGTSNKKGNFAIKIKPKKAGTKVTVSVLTPEGYTNQKTKKIVKTYGYPELTKYVYRSSKRASIAVYGGNKGDRLKVKIGSKIYTKKLKKNKKKQKISLKIKKAAAGTKIKMTLYDKFGKKKDTYTGMVYYGNTISVGMSAKNALLTTWGAPTRKNHWGTVFDQWVFTSGSSTLYVYVKNGKVISIQHLNY